MFIGLDLPEITAGLEETDVPTAIVYGLLITAVLIVGRIISAYSAVVVTLIARNFITVADASNPGMKVPLILGWSGMRGVVSLAAALSIPTLLEDGSPFPHRNLILFITFIVILTTLLLQGLTLPFLIKKLTIPDPDNELPDEELYNQLRKELAINALQYLRQNHNDHLDNEPLLQQLVKRLEDTSTSIEPVFISHEGRVIYTEILNRQRELLVDRNKKDNINEEIVRRHLLLLDMEEEKIRLL